MLRSGAQKVQGLHDLVRYSAELAPKKKLRDVHILLTHVHLNAVCDPKELARSSLLVWP